MPYAARYAHHSGVCRAIGVRSPETVAYEHSSMIMLTTRKLGLNTQHNCGINFKFYCGNGHHCQASAALCHGTFEAAPLSPPTYAGIQVDLTQVFLDVDIEGYTGVWL